MTNQNRYEIMSALNKRGGVIMAVIIDDQPTTEVREVHEIHDDRRETSSTAIVVGVLVVILVLLLLLFGRGAFKGNSSTAPASSGPAPSGTDTTLPSGTSPTAK